jgi:hypothetical protein
MEKQAARSRANRQQNEAMCVPKSTSQEFLNAYFHRFPTIVSNETALAVRIMLFLISGIYLIKSYRFPKMRWS